MRSGKPLGVLLAAAMSGLAADRGAGHHALTDMFTPRFRLPHAPQYGDERRTGKHRMSGRGSYRMPHHNAPKQECGAKQTAKYARQISTQAFNVHFERRMRWNETVYPLVVGHQVGQLVDRKS